MTKPDNFGDPSRLPCPGNVQGRLPGYNMAGLSALVPTPNPLSRLPVLSGPACLKSVEVEMEADSKVSDVTLEELSVRRVAIVVFRQQLEIAAAQFFGFELQPYSH